MWEMTLNRPMPSATVRDSQVPPPRIDSDLDARLLAWHRAGLVVTGLALVSGLIVARALTPDPSGMGTHSQLGFSPCSFMQRIGIPCPACGMTTSWSHLTRGQWVESMRCNIGGFMFGLQAMFCGPWMIASGVFGRWIWVRAGLTTTVALAAVTFFALLAQWLARLMN